MGFLKGCLKAVGTVALGAATVASKVLEEASDIAGFELGQELFGAAKEASKNGIFNMWEGGMEVDDEGNTALRRAIDGADDSTRGAGRKKMADTAKRMAELAKQNGDMEQYEHYMEQYEKYRY